MADRGVEIVKPVFGETRSELVAKTASTALDKNSLVKLTSGQLVPSADNDVCVFAKINVEIASTDSDYASATEVSVTRIHPGDLVRMKYTGGTPVKGAVYGISNAYTVDVGDTSNKVFRAWRVDTDAVTVDGFFLKTYMNDTGA